jgi:hypothetical protein
MDAPHAYMVIGDQVYEIVEYEQPDRSYDHCEYTVHVRAGRSYKRIPLDAPPNHESFDCPRFDDSFYIPPVE